MERKVEAQVLRAIRGSSVVLFLVDGRAGLTPVDERLGRLLRRLCRQDVEVEAEAAGAAAVAEEVGSADESRPSLVLAVNKVDHALMEERAGYFADFWSLGLGEPRPLSAYHGTGVADVLSAVAARMPPAAHAPPADAAAADAAEIAAADAEIAAALEHDGAECDEYEYYDDLGGGYEYLDEYLDEPAGELGGCGGAPAGSASADSAVDAAALREYPDGLGPEALELKLAVVGRPNVGKSSLVNRLLEEDRHVVHHSPGTTRDAVSSPIEWKGQRILIADTAGIRRHAAGGEQREELDRMAVARAKQMIMSSHVAMVLFDAKQGLTRGDLQVAALVVEHHKSCVLVANKMDLLTAKERGAVAESVANRLPMLGYAPLVEASVVRRTGLGAAMDLVTEAAAWRRMRVPRRRLNELFQRAQLLRPLPYIKGRTAAGASRPRVLYVQQAFTESPTFVFHLNRQVELHTSDLRWLENTIRAQWAFTGTPLRIVLRARERRRRRRAEGATPAPGRAVATPPRLAVGRVGKPKPGRGTRRPA